VKLLNLLPKISEIKNLKDLSKPMALPMLIASYTWQKDFAFIEKLTSKSVSGVLQNFLIIGGIYLLLHVGLAMLKLQWKFNLMPFLAVLFFTFGFIGVFAGDKARVLDAIHHSWFYTSFAVGFYLVALDDDLTEFEKKGRSSREK